MKHGASSPRLVEPAAVELARRAYELCPWLSECDAHAVAAWARVETQVGRIVGWLAEKGGELDAAGGVRPAAEYLQRLDAHAERLRSRLGLDPLSRARLGLDLARGADITRLWVDGGTEGESGQAAVAGVGTELVDPAAARG